MNNRPKRRKHKDNPYTLIVKEEQYYVEFRDVLRKTQLLSISKEIFECLDRFELDDLKELNEFDNHIEHSEIYEDNLNERAKYKPESLETLVEKKVINELLYENIALLPEIQRKRLIQYYFYDMTLDEIGKIEGCSKTAIKYSIDRALEKISKKMKK